jgi:hypothetical protein
MYYTVIIQNDNTQAIFAYATLNEAKAKYHSELAYRAEGRTSTKCAILTSDLGVLFRDEYRAEPNTEELTEG